MIKTTLIEYLRQQIKQSKEDWNNHDSYCIEITPDHARLIVDELSKELAANDDTETDQLISRDGQGTPIVDEYGTITCNCEEPQQRSFPGEKWVCLKCWGEWYH